MNSKELIETITGKPNILGQIYADVLSPSARAIGSALGTVFEFSTSFLLPVKLLNEKFKAIFAKRLEEYNKKLQEIPEDQRCEVHPQIGVPIIERLSYTTTDEIAGLFTTLLSCASDKNRSNLAHPSFIGIIEHLSSDEARIIKYLKGKEFVEYCDIRGKSKDGNGFNTLLPKQTLISKDVFLEYPQNIQAYLSNLESLGIIVNQVGLHKASKNGEEAIKRYIGYDNLEKQLVPNVFTSLVPHRGFYDVTALGKMFIDACIK